mmetsp:Transcript_29557/g.34801  ORF Transcript_29557/g.34801 Transcript_29557/m.34801 type:complete len:1178 (-) Transcript_29557:556-4089(-)
MMKHDLAMEAAVAKEQHLVSQNKGRDGSMKLSLLSELRITSPIAFLIRRALYKLESAMGSISNRIYALLATVVFLLVFSAGIFIAGTFLEDQEWESLREDAGVDADSGAHDQVIFYALWLTWCFFVDPGSHTQKLDHTKYRYARLTSAFISVLGILFFSLVLGFVVDLLSSFIARVTEGSTTVVEEGHYLILGYSEKCVAVIGELATAMESDGGGVIVVLADSPTKREFDQNVKAHMNFLGLSNKTRVVFRVGNPLITSNIAKVSPETSRAIILLSDSRMDADHADASVLHIILSLKSLIGGKNHVDRRISSPDIGIFATYQQEIDPFYDAPIAQSDPMTDSDAVRGFATSQRHVLSPIPSPVPKIPPPSPTSQLELVPNNQFNSADEYMVSPNKIEPISTPSADLTPKPYHEPRPSLFSTCRDCLSKCCSKVCCLCLWLCGSSSHRNDDDDSLGSEVSQQGPKEFTGHVVAELQDNDNRPMIQVSGGSLVELVVIHDIIGRMLAKSVVQPNIRRIYDELLGFDGCEFYFARHPELANCNFREASLRMQGAVLVGVKRDGVIMLNPDSQLPNSVTARGSSYRNTGVTRRQFVLRPDDEVIVIAEDDSSYKILDRPIFDDAKGARPWPPQLPLKSALGVVLAKEDEEMKRHAMATATEMPSSSILNEATEGETKNPETPVPLRKVRSAVEDFLADRELSGHNSDDDLEEGDNEDEDGEEDDGDDRMYNEMSLDHSPTSGWQKVREIVSHVGFSLSSLSPTSHHEDEHSIDKSGDPQTPPPPNSPMSPVRLMPSTERLDHQESLEDRRGSGIIFNQWSPFSRQHATTPKRGIHSLPGSTSSLGDYDNSLDFERVDALAKESLQELRDLAEMSQAVYDEVNAEFQHKMGGQLRRSNSLVDMKQSFDSQNPPAPLTEMERDDERGINVLMCGWRRDVKDMLRLMDKCLPRGSSVHILCEKPTSEVQEYLTDHCTNLIMDIRHSNGRADIRRRLVEYDALGFKVKMNAVDVIVVVTDESKEKDLLMSDSQTIACCLLVRDVQADHLENRDVSLTDLSVPRLEALQVSCPMTCEVLDVATRATIEENPSIKALAEFVVVNDLAARLIAAVADRREVAAVLGELLGPDSQDIFVVESRELLYEDEVVPNRAAACVEVGDSQVRNFKEVRHFRHNSLTPPYTLGL